MIGSSGSVPTPADTGITDEMIEAAAQGIARPAGWPRADSPGAELMRRSYREQAKRALEAALAGCTVVALPDNWREQLAELERDEYAAAVGVGSRPSIDQRIAFEAGIEAATSWFDRLLPAVSESSNGGDATDG